MHEGHAVDLMVLDPTADRSGRNRDQASEIAANPAPSTGTATRVILLSNSKPNVDNLFRGIAEGLNARGVADIRVFDKGSAPVSISSEVLDEVTSNCDLFVTAMADCGSCTSWSVHDSIAVETGGTPAIVITTDKFIQLGQLEARALGVPDMHFEMIPHPVAGIAPELAADRGRALAETIAAFLLDKTAAPAAERGQES
jgi:hypothetical protein